MPTKEDNKLLEEKAKADASKASGTDSTSNGNDSPEAVESMLGMELLACASVEGGGPREVDPPLP